MEAGLRLGVGKAEQESFFISADNVTRKRLETEVQADEDYERTIKREVCCLDSHLTSARQGAKPSAGFRWWCSFACLLGSVESLFQLCWGSCMPD